MLKYITPLMIFVLFSATASASTGRFFYEGNGSLSIINKNTGHKATVQYRAPNGTYNEAAIHELDEIFEMPARRLGEDVSLRLISMLDYLEDHFVKGQTLTMLSGFRTKEHNSHLKRAARTSYHLDGMAADLIFPGIPSRQVWDYVRSLNCCGAGYYFGKSVHIDSGRPRFWTSVGSHRAKGELKNHYVYLATDKDIYHPGETMRLFLSAVSDYPFGIRTEFQLEHKKRYLLSFNPNFHGKQSDGICQPIRSREEARFMTWEIPADWKGPDGPLNVEIHFCNHHWKDMPSSLISKPFLSNSL